MKIIKLLVLLIFSFTVHAENCNDIFLKNGDVIRGVKLYSKVIDGEIVVVFYKVNGFIKSHIPDTEVDDMRESDNCLGFIQSERSQTIWKEMNRIKNLETREQRLDEWRKNVKGKELVFKGIVKSINPDGTVMLDVDDKSRVQVNFVKNYQGLIQGSVVFISAYIEQFGTLVDFKFEDGKIYEALTSKPTNFEVRNDSRSSGAAYKRTKAKPTPFKQETSRDCFACKGTGKTDCPQCVNGQYQDIINKEWIACPYCDGIGWTLCTFCNGSGKR